MSTIPRELIDRLRCARHVVVLTGAGISAESGIPTFRGAQDGLWSRYRAEDLATPQAFARDPRLVWQWYQSRRELIARARPNPGHVAIAGLERMLNRVTLVTQNVDGLHQQAGSGAVIEFHGNIHRNICSAERRPVEVQVAGTKKPPRCPNCGEPVRPDVVWFGEPIPRPALLAASAAAADCDVFISAGTSLLVHPAAGLLDLARAAGAMLADINTDTLPGAPALDLVLRGPAGMLLPAIVGALGEDPSRPH